MADTKVPGLGGVNKPTLIIAGLAGVGAVIYAYEKKKKNAAATAAAATTNAAGYGYGYAYGAAGYGYGAELMAQEQALANEYAYGGYGYGGIGGYGVGTSVPPVNTLQPAASNAEWSQAAVTFLTNQGYDPATVSGALGAYISGAAVTSTQESIIQAAIAFEGYPPIAGPGNYPPNIHAGTSTGQTGGTGGGGVTSAGAISNLAVRSKTATGFTAQWNPALNASQGYRWVVTGGGVNKPGSTKGTTASVSGLKKGQTYNFGIQALPGGPGDNMHVTL